MAADRPRPTEVLEALQAAEAQTTQAPALLRDLRAWLQGHLEGAQLSTAAKALKLSSRTLQRRLEEAKRLLEQTDAPLTQIAFDIGCASLPSFSRLFRRGTGKSPSAWREGRKRSPA